LLLCGLQRSKPVKKKTRKFNKVSKSIT